MARNITGKDLTTAMQIQKKRDDQRIATHDNPIFRSVPATGVRGDQPAGDAWKNLLKDESLLRTNDRLNRASGFVAPTDTSNMPTDPNDPFSTPKWVLFKKIQRALKDLSPKEYERRKQNGTLPHFGMDMEDLQYYLEDLEAGKAPDRGHPDTHDYLVGPQEEMMIGNTGGIKNKEYNRPRGGPGGTDSFPYDDFGNDRNTPIINPSTGRPEWAIADGTHRPDTEWPQHGHPGPLDEGSPHKQYLPDGTPIYQHPDGEWNRNLPEIEISDHRTGSRILNTLPRGGYYGNSHREAIESGDLTRDKLIKTLKIAAPYLKA